MESDAVTTATPLLNGVVVQQQTPAGGFSNFSLNGNMVISLTGLSLCGSDLACPKRWQDCSPPTATAPFP